MWLNFEYSILNFEIKLTSFILPVSLYSYRMIILIILWQLVLLHFQLLYDYQFLRDDLTDCEQYLNILVVSEERTKPIK